MKVRIKDPLTLILQNKIFCKYKCLKFAQQVQN